MSTNAADSPTVTPARWSQLVGQGPIGGLLSALEGHPGFGWTLKESASLRLVAHRGELPHLDPALVGQGALLEGCLESELFEKHQAMLIRLSDLRALNQGRPAQEIHHFEAQSSLPAGDDGVREWTAWRWPVGEGSSPGWLVTVWLNRQITARHEEQVRQGQRQVHAQQMMMAELRRDASFAHPPDALARFCAHEDFLQHLRREIDLSRREHRHLAVLLVDVDVRGLSAAGAETAIALVARQLTTGVRAMDTVTQIAESRFGVLLSGAALTPAHARAEAMRRAAGAQLVVDGGVAHPLTLSIGVGAFPHSARQLEDLMCVTQAALDEAVADGAGRSVVARLVLEEPPKA